MLKILKLFNFNFIFYFYFLRGGYYSPPPTPPFGAYRWGAGGPAPAGGYLSLIVTNNYYEYNNKNAIIKENNPVASAKANPKIA